MQIHRSGCMYIVNLLHVCHVTIPPCRHVYGLPCHRSIDGVTMSMEPWRHGVFVTLENGVV
eukprot:11576469-Karenia_brevis.AAC.1